MAKVIFDTIRNCSKRTFVSKFFPLREVPILSSGAIEENHCLVQQSAFDMRNFFSVQS